MLDLDLVINVFMGILFYKAVIAIVELSLLKILSMLLGKVVTKKNYKKECDKALCKHTEVKPAELN